MKSQLSLITLALTALMASSTFAGDIKPLHFAITNRALPIAAGQYCDVYLMNSNGVRTYTSAAVLDKGGVQPPKLGVKVGKWLGPLPPTTGGDCALGAAGQVYSWHVQANVPGYTGGVAYDHGHASVNGHGGLNTAWAGAAGHTLTDQWQSPDATGASCLGNTCTADNNPRMSKHSNMAYSQYYCVQVCKYASNQHTPGGATTLAGSDAYDVLTHSHDAAPAGHNPVTQPGSFLVTQLCNDQIWGTCAFNY
jgi:hypothetical protein